MMVRQPRNHELSVDNSLGGCLLLLNSSLLVSELQPIETAYSLAGAERKCSLHLLLLLKNDLPASEWLPSLSRFPLPSQSVSQSVINHASSLVTWPHYYIHPGHSPIDRSITRGAASQSYLSPSCPRSVSVVNRLGQSCSSCWSQHPPKLSSVVTPGQASALGLPVVNNNVPFSDLPSLIVVTGLARPRPILIL